MERYCLMLAVAFVVDLLMGDPRWLWHPVRGIGTLIATLEPWLRKALPATKTGERWAGCALVALVCALSVGVTRSVLWLCALVGGGTVAFVVETFLCAQLLATRSLYSESMAVYHRLQAQDIAGGRYAVSMIVGRDTDQLDADGITRATVETVAENFSDGVLAPMVFLLLGGAPGMMLYKAVNTMDSMVGYKNDRYQYFGTAAARLDDVLNFVPARLGGVLMALTSPLVGLDGKGSFRVFFRDRKCHKSPNSAHTEAATAGALGVALGGNSYYGGNLVEKPTIGDDTRPICPKDIAITNRLMVATAVVSVGLACLICWMK